MGPRVVDNLTITRHMVMEFGNAAYEGRKIPLTSSLVPGVMAKTGMESQEIISGVVAQTHPDLVLVIDALAARSIKRLNRTIQISNAGINPGSGVGNYRNAIQEENLGVPVIALGVPTVVDAATIVQDVVFKDCSMEDQDFLDRKEKITGAMDELLQYVCDRQRRGLRDPADQPYHLQCHSSGTGVIKNMKLND